MSANPNEVFRQVFSLSTAANAANFRIGTQGAIQCALQAQLPRILTHVSGQWEVVWGPVVWKEESENSETGPDNSWFVAHNPSVAFDDGSTREAYVVAIAGTPGNSAYAWRFENLAVDKVMNFSAWAESNVTQPPVPVSSILPGKTYSANGTTTTVHKLLTERSPVGAASEGLTLYQFLSGLSTSSSTRFVFTGHSLGGALCSTLALAVVTSGTLQGEVLVYPTAGPSPGNGNFAKLFAETFPASPAATSDVEYAVWNTNVINSLDIVPQAWCTKPLRSPKQNMTKIPSLYGPVLPFIAIATHFLKFLPNISHTVYIPLQSRIISGTEPVPAPKDGEEFVYEALRNHQDFYWKLFGIDPEDFTLQDDELPEKSEEDKLLGLPVIGIIEWGVKHRAEAEKIADAIPEDEGEPDDE